MSAVETLLEASRKKLLDLTLRNQLLNYRLSKKGRLVIVDELPDVLYEKLVFDNKHLTFQGVLLPKIKEGEPLPSVEEQAQTLGIQTSLELPLKYEESPSKHTDNVIQTLHYPNDLEKRLSKKRREAKSALLETGANLLFLAVGFLEWKQEEKSYLAPLILIPVTLKKDKFDEKRGVYKYTLSYTGEDLLSNYSLQYKMKNDLGITLPEFDEEQTPEEYFSKVNALSEHHHAILSVKRIIALDFFYFSKLLMYKDLDPNAWKEFAITSHPILQEITGEIAMEVKERPEIDETMTETLPFVLDADKSQREASMQVLNGDNLIIEGPPGTGKSQTIANLISLLLSQGKSVLFVAEKLVALEVVKKRLDAIGLGDFVLELHSNKTNKSEFYAGLKKRIEKELSFDETRLEASQKELEKIRKETQTYLQALHQPIEVISLSAYQILGEVQNRTHEAYETISSIEANLLISHEEAKTIASELKVLLETTKEDRTILESKWLGFYATEAIVLDKEAIVEHFERYRSLLEEVSRFIREDERLIKSRIDFEFIQNAGEARESIENMPSVNLLLSLNHYGNEALETLIKQFSALQEHLAFVERIDTEYLKDLSEIKETARVLRTHREIGFFGKLFNGEYKSYKKKFASFFKITDADSPLSRSEEIEALITSIETCNATLSTLSNMTSQTLLDSLGISTLQIGTLLDFKRLKEEMANLSLIESACRWKKEMNNHGFSEEVIGFFISNEGETYKEKMLSLVKEHFSTRQNIEEIIKKIETFGFLNEETFFEGKNAILTRNDLLSKKLDEQDSLGYWIDVSRPLYTIEKHRITKVLSYAKEMSLLDKLDELFLFAYYRDHAFYLLRENRVLSQFNRPLFEKAIEHFRKKDKAIQSTFADSCAYRLSQITPPKGVNGKVSEKSEMFLLQNETAKQRRHLPIRQSLKRANRSIKALKPCFMMSPLSVSQYLDPAQEPFDVMIMDEASQVFPEDALGAIVRSKQIVVVGDPSQMPPTSFFNSLGEESHEDESIMGDAESILDLLLRIYPQIKRLQWHYRSRHESLINYSNLNFYDGELKIFPSPLPQGSETGIVRHYIDQGYYEKQLNPKEAEVMIEKACKHLRESQESLGLVTMNKKQSELLEELLEERGKEDSVLALRIDEAMESNRLFIKNLESVQGDEADVLFIGTTYGKDRESQKVHQRFGPINQAQGWRRINVLVTRAKKRIELFTSLNSTDIVEDISNKGRTSFRNYLSYVESIGEREKSELDESTNSDVFITSVIRFLRDQGFDAEAKVGVSGFFVDIAVKSEGESAYLLGIECDGENYASSEAMRDRDRLKRSVLENMGWDMYDIWITEWFKHPKEEKERLLKKINEKVARKK